MNPNAQPFEPRLQINSQIVSSTDTSCTQKSIKRGRRQRRESRAANKTDGKTEHNVEDLNQPHCNNHTKKQQISRRRQRCNSRKVTISENSIQDESNSQQGTDAVPAAKSRARNRNRRRTGREDKLAVSKLGSTETVTSEPNDTWRQRGDNNVDSSFPALSSCHSTKNIKGGEAAGERFWSDCLTKKTPQSISLGNEQDADERSEDLQNAFSKDSNVPLTMLTSHKPSHRCTINNNTTYEDQLTLDETIDKQKDTDMRSESQIYSNITNQIPALPNVRLKWNQHQLTRMRQRWWDAEHAKRRMDIETKKRQDEIIGDSEDESTVSSCSSSESDDEAYYMQPPSLNQPFDESLSSKSANVESELANIHHSFSQQIITLEQRCLDSQRPLHFIIRHYYLLQQDCQQLSDAETVFTRLLKMQGACNLRKHERMNLYDLFPDDDLIIPGIRLHSADVEALTPFQLAIVLNLPILIRVWLSKEDTKVVCLEDELGRTPLMLACELHRIECIKTLLSLIVKPKLDYRESKGGNSAYFCCYIGKKILTTDVERDNSAAAALEILMNNTPYPQQKRALISINKERQSLLHMACYSGV